MEKQMKNDVSNVRSTFVKMAMLVVLLANSFNLLHAQNISTSPEPEIKYIGVFDDQLVFEIEYNNEAQSPFSLEIRDENGYQFYFSKFKQKGFKKKYAISKAELGNSSITFLLTAHGNSTKQVFDVNASSRVVEEVSVVKL